MGAESSAPGMTTRSTLRAAHAGSSPAGPEVYRSPPARDARRSHVVQGRHAPVLEDVAVQRGEIRTRQKFVNEEVLAEIEPTAFRAAVPCCRMFPVTTFALAQGSAGAVTSAPMAGASGRLRSRVIDGLGRSPSPRIEAAPH